MGVFSSCSITGIQNSLRRKILHSTEQSKCSWRLCLLRDLQGGTLYSPTSWFFIPQPPLLLHFAAPKCIISCVMTGISVFLLKCFSTWWIVDCLRGPFTSSNKTQFVIQNKRLGLFFRAQLFYEATLLTLQPERKQIMRRRRCVSWVLQASEGRYEVANCLPLCSQCAEQENEVAGKIAALGKATVWRMVITVITSHYSDVKSLCHPNICAWDCTERGRLGKSRKSTLTLSINKLIPLHFP